MDALILPRWLTHQVNKGSFPAIITAGLCMQLADNTNIFNKNDSTWTSLINQSRHPNPSNTLHSQHAA